MRRLCLTILLVTLLSSISLGERRSISRGQALFGLSRRVTLTARNEGSEGSEAIEATEATITLTSTNSTANATDLPEEITESPPPNRIVGGRQISISEVPWQAALIRDGNFICGASVVSTIWVLTAAHCVYGYGNRVFVVRAGSDFFRTGGQAIRVDFIAIHGLYQSNGNDYDVAMLRMRRRFIFGANVQPIRLPSRYSRIPNTFLITGWGSTEQSSTNPTQRLRGARINLYNQATCRSNYNGIYTITKNMICAAAVGRDTCQGDSGGALVSNGIQYGIVSFGEGCARVQYPGVYTNVKMVQDWILTVANAFSRNTFGVGEEQEEEQESSEGTNKIFRF